MKQTIAKEIDATWPKNTVNAKDRAKQLEKRRAEKRQLEIDEEKFIVELESAGMIVERRGNVSPEIFLEFQTPTKWNRQKLDNLWSAISGERSRVSQVNDELHEVVMGLATQRSLAERSMTMNDKERFQRKSADLEREKTEVVTRRDTIEAKLSPLHKLHNNCVNFLREKGVDGFAPTVARVVSRAS
jgi:hypothetical protein